MIYEFQERVGENSEGFDSRQSFKNISSKKIQDCQRFKFQVVGYQVVFDM